MYLHGGNDLKPLIGSRWRRKKRWCVSLFGYTIIGLANVEHNNPKRPPEVVYQGDNGFLWTMKLSEWPGNLVKITES